MAELVLGSAVPVPEALLRDLSKDIFGVIPKFSEKEPVLGVKELYAVIGPILDTADSAELSPSHRAAAYNILCAIIEKCQASDAQYAQNALLDDFIWMRLLDIYLVRSDNAKSKSIRQVLLVLTGVLLKNANERSIKLQAKAAVTFIEIICQRQDRLKVKPALLGLAHFIQKGAASITQLIEVYATLLERSPGSTTKVADAASLFTAFLSWTVHHDTSLPAGHLIRSFLTQLRRSEQYARSSDEERTLPIWIQPAVETLRLWPDRIQEFKTHVFPHCFLPTFHEFLRFLSYLHFDRHVGFAGFIPHEIKSLDEHYRRLEDLDEFRILLAAIETGKELGIVKDLDYRLCKSIEIRGNAVYLPDVVFGGWLSHPEPEVRLAGLHLSVYTSAITRPITGGVFSSLRRNMIHLHAETDANSRRELLSYIQKLFNRLRGSTATLAKHLRSATTSEDRLPFPKQSYGLVSASHMPIIDDPISESLQFIVWYTGFLKWELRSEASYQRRITAVRALIVVLKSGLDPRVPHHLLSKGAQGQLHWKHGLQISDSKLVRSLLDLSLDPFDDVRDASVSALHLCLHSMSSFERKTALAKLPGFIGRAEAAMLRTGRADQADGVARAYSLLFTSSTHEIDTHLQLRRSEDTSRFAILRELNQQLKDTLAVAGSNLSEAVKGRPVHGTFAAIRYIADQDDFYSNLDLLSDDGFSAWKSMHDELLSSVEFLWFCVIGTLCADAPEGHVLDEFEEEASLDTKEVLSYSWRSLKEASILLRVIITKAPIGVAHRALLPPTLVEKFGNLCFTQLVELRHRGAFSTVAQTFTAFCRRCVSADDPALSMLPEKWYEETLSTIQAKADTITRRSGGLPALMVGIVAAEPQPGGKLFARAMQDLIAEASVDARSSNIEESRLPQVHALNCIKDFFMTSRLSLASESYMGAGLELAARTLNSHIWPIRNCSLMLFKALIERLLGSDEAQDWKEREGTKTSRFSYDNFPSLIVIIQSLLDPEGPLKKSLDTPNSNSPMELHGAEGVFPALQILRQALPPEEHRAAILKSVMKLFGSPHWHLRDMAARTATILQPSSESPLPLLNCFGESINAQHGTLLCAKYMLSRMLQDVTRLNNHTPTELLLDIGDIIDKHMQHVCPFIKLAIMDLISLCGMAITKLPTSESLARAWAKLTASVLVGPQYDLGTSSAADSALFQQSLAKVFFIDRVVLRPGSVDVMQSKNYQNIGDALILLASYDPDTCLAALNTLDDIIQLKTPRGPLMQFSLVLLHIFCLVRDATEPEVLSKAHSILANGLSHSGIATGVLSLIMEEDLLSTINKLKTQCLKGAPSNMRGALHLLGLCLDWTYQRYPAHRATICENFALYIRLLRMTMIDTNPFDDRFAAVQSVSALAHIWTMSAASKKTGSLLLGLAFVLYDMLNDDDDEIRDAASITTSRLLQAQLPGSFHIVNNPAVPVSASHQLAKFLICAFPTSSDLCKEATCRLTGSPSRNPLFNTTFAETFAQTRKEDTALFASEKQNLYKDDTLDAALWARVLASLPVHAISASLRSSLTTWVIKALEVLTVTAKSEIDGALGWTAKSEVFTLGMSVFYAAEVILTWETLSVEASQVRRLLREFADAAGGSEVHGLWIEKVERVLETSVVNRLKSVKERLGGVQIALGL